jgi:hypothetical protein
MARCVPSIEMIQRLIGVTVDYIQKWLKDPFGYGEQMNHHHCDCEHTACEHTRVAYCKTCDVVYCLDCKMEWVENHLLS